MTDAPPFTLRQHLDAVARATGLRIGMTSVGMFDVPEVVAFREAVGADPDLELHARTMLQSLDERVLMRDHVSRWTKAALEAALPVEVE